MLQQKRSELLRLLFIVAMLALTVGVIFVYSAKVDSSSQTAVPALVKGGNDTTFNFSISVAADSNAVKRVDVNRPAAFTVINCPVNIPAAWTCTKDNADLLRFQEATTGIIAGSSVSFEINATASSTGGNSTWTVDTYETTGASNLNSSKFNITIDVDAPRLVNISLQNSSGAIIANATTLSNGTIYLRLTDFVFNVTVYDTGGAEPAGVALYYNYNHSRFFPDMVNPSISTTYNSTYMAVLSNVSRKTPFTDVFYNATILNSSFHSNATLAFAILANDSVGNANLTNGSFKMSGQSNASSYFFNITLDGNAPLIYNITLGGASSVVKAYNVTTSSTVITLSVNVNDTNEGGSGVGSVVAYTSDSATTAVLTRSGTSTIYNYTGTLASLGATTGDHKLRLTILAVDAVGNANSTFFDLEIDDDAPTFTGAVTVNGTAVNATNNFVSNNLTQLNFSVTVNGNINVSHNATINGPNGVVFQMLPRSARETGDVAYNGSVLWFTINASKSPRSNLTQYGCPDNGDGRSDGLVCQLQFNATDIFGRVNSTNFTITFDDVPPAVVNITVNNTAATERNNIAFKAGAKLAFGVNAYNNVWNVTIGTAGTSTVTHNMTAAVTNYSFTLNVSDVCEHQGPCLVNFTATDLARNINFSNASFLIIRDDIAPNISAPAVSGSNFTGPGSLSNTTLGIMNPVRIARSDRVINLTVNVIDFNSTTTVLNVTVQNSTAATMKLWNSSSDWYNITTLARLGCSASVEAQCILTFNATDNASNINNSIDSPNQFNLTFRVDDLAPRVLNFSTDLTSGIGRNVTSVTATVINFSVNISDANMWNVTIQNTTVRKMNLTTTTTSNTTTLTYWVMSNLNDLGCTSNGDCYVTINATDLAGNINATQSITVTADSSDLSINNRTWNAVFYFDSTPTFSVNTSKAAICRYSTTGVIGYSQMTTPFDNNGTRHSSATLPSTADGSYEYDVSCVDVAGTGERNSTVKFTIDTINDTTIAISNLTDTGSVFISAKPTVHVNLSANAVCRYSGAGGTYTFADMTSPFNVNGTRHNSFTVASDLRDNDYAYPVACTTANGQNNITGTVRFAVDTRSLWNLTIGINGYNGGTGSGTYFTESNKFYSFQMDNAILVIDAPYLSGTTVNVSNVLPSILSANPSGSSNNLTILYALNATSGTVTSYVPGRATGNTLNNFTANGLTYYANFSVANERIEVT